jgi:hypothetical protein
MKTLFAIFFSTNLFVASLSAPKKDSIFPGASDRSPSYPANAWEYPVYNVASHYTYYIPLTNEMAGKKIDIVVLGIKGGIAKFIPRVYLTCNPKPYQKMELILLR